MMEEQLCMSELSWRVKTMGYSALVESHCQMAQALAAQQRINERLEAALERQAARLDALEAAVADMAGSGSPGR